MKRRPSSGTWNRRQFLTTLGTAALIRPSGLFGAEPSLADAATVVPPGTLAGAPRFRIIRPRDLLAFDLELLNLEVVRNRAKAGTELEIVSHGANGFVILHFSGQHIAEQAIWDRGGQMPPGTPVPGQTGDPPPPLTYRLWRPSTDSDSDLNFLTRPGQSGLPRTKDPDMLHGLAGAWMSGPSQLVFELPQRLTPIRFDLDELLRLCAEELELVVAPGVAAVSDADNQQASPQQLLDGQIEPVVGHHPGGLHDAGAVPYTVVEFPALLNLSPYRTARWRLRPAPVDGRAELWAFQLEAPDGGPLAGKPRYVQPRGHLFAFGWRSASEARWPSPDKASPSDPSLKYLPSERPKTALYEATRKLLVKQLFEDNGDIVAERFRLSALGTTARLHYNPALDVPDQENIEGAKPRDNGNFGPKKSDPNAEGMLSEWQQKTESGRDFYSKESFSGYWMPFGFKAEVVTITERLLSSPNDPPAPKAASDETLVDLNDDEGQLTAFLIARKFGRIRGSRVRRFSDPESADFSESAGEAGRRIGLQQVEVLVERTPVLANQQADSPTPADEVKAISEGRDAIVDGGSGVNAAREIFWPRVQDFIVDDQGRPVRRLVVYKFPVRFTFLDGSTRTTEMPMLFVPTLSKGEALYPSAGADLRTSAIGVKMPLVQPPPTAAVAAADLGAPDQVARVAHHLRGFLPASFQPLLTPTDRKPLTATAITGGVSAAVAEGLNLALGNLPAEIARRVTQVKTQLKDFAETEDGFSARVADFLAKADPFSTKEQVEAIVADVRRATAWGEQLADTIDVTQAAERLNRLFSPATDPLNDDFAGKVASAIAALQGNFGVLKGLPEQAKNDLNTDLSHLKDRAKGDVTTYNKTLRQFLVHWAVWLGATWQRSDWDKTFQEVVNIFDPAAGKAVRLSALQKELQRALLRGAKDIALPLSSGAPIKIRIPDLAATVPPVVDAALGAAVNGVMADIKKMAGDKVEALNRLGAALNSALGEERGLISRVQWLAQDYATLPAAQLKLQLSRVMADVQTHLLFAFTHYEDGRVRWERFLQTALSAEELVRQARTATLREWQIMQTNASKAVKDAVESVRAPIAKTVQEAKKTAATAGESLKRLVMITNPDHLQQRFNDFASLTGGRLTGDLHEAFGRVSARVNQLLGQLQKLSAESPANPAKTRATLEETFGLARQLVGPYRNMLERLLQTAQNDLKDTLVEVAKDIATVNGLANHFASYATQEEGHLEFVSWRLGAAARDLIDDVQRVLAAANQAKQTATQKAAQDLKNLGAAIDQDLRTSAAVSQQTLRNIQTQLSAVAGRLDAELQARITALENVVTAWVKDAENRAEDLLEHLVVTLWGVLAHSEADFEKVLGHLLKDLGEDALQEALGKIPAVMEVATALRKITGESEDFVKRLDQLAGGAKTTAEALFLDLTNKAADIGNVLVDKLQDRLSHAEGDILAMAKRAALSLPSPALLNEFQDQTRKAIFQTAQVAFSVKTIGDGVRSFLAHPHLESLDVRIPGIDHANKTIKYAKDYLCSGLRDAKRAANEVFADLVDTAANTLGPTAGIADVTAKVNSLSREIGNLSTGAVAALGKVEAQVQAALSSLRSEGRDALNNLKAEAGNLEAQAAALLPVDPKLFNKLPLKDLIQVIQSPGELPKTIAREFPDRIERTFSFSKEAKSLNVVIVTFHPAAGCRFKVDSRVILWLPGPGRAPRPPSSSVRGQLDAFSLEIATLLRINFVSFSFVSENGSFQCVPRLGKAPPGGAKGGENQVDPESVVEFLGALAFVNDLRKTLGKILADHGLTLQIDKNTIFAGLRIPVPDITLGVVAVTNLALNMSVGLPLTTGPLRYRFALSDPKNTFRVAVTIFAGGGFFALDLASQPELCKVEVALEFGGSLSLSVGFASGSVSVMAGIYYSWSGSATVFSAYIRVCGNVTVLGFIEVSIVIYLALGYQKAGNQSQLHGIATITISVKIGFFSKSFSLTYEKTIAGSEAKSTDDSSSGGQAALDDDSGLGYYERMAASEFDRSASRRQRLTGTLAHNEEKKPPSSASARASTTKSAKKGPPRFSEAMGREHFLDYWNAFDHGLTTGCAGGKSPPVPPKNPSPIRKPKTPPSFTPQS